MTPERQDMVALFARCADRVWVADVLTRAGQPPARRSTAAHWVRAKLCPLCEGRDCFSFTQRRWKCHRGCGSGDAVALHSKLTGLRPLEAARDLLGEGGDAEAAPRAPARRPRVAADRPNPEHRESADDKAARLWACAVAARAHAAARAYFFARGLWRFEVARVALDCLRAVDALPWVRLRNGLWLNPPALLARPCTPAGAVAGVHRTYMAPGGAGKATLAAYGLCLDDLHPDSPEPQAKRMAGAQCDQEGRPGGVLLIDSDDPGAVMCVGEGIETTVALAGAARANGARAVRAFAALSLDRLQGTPTSAMAWRAPAIDAAKPAALIGHRGPVLIATDGDMSPLELRPPWPGARAQTISPRRRQEVSGALAAAWWALPVTAGGAGASEVSVWHAPAGCDAADVFGLFGRSA